MTEPSEAPILLPAAPDPSDFEVGALMVSRPAVTAKVVVVSAALARTAVPTHRAVAAATAIGGNNSATWNPTVTVTPPDGAISGGYNGTITYSVS